MVPLLSSDSLRIGWNKLTVYDVLEVAPLPRKMLKCLWCKENRQVESGFCSPSHSKLYRERAIDTLLKSPGGVGSGLLMVLAQKDRVVAERKAKRIERAKE